MLTLSVLRCPTGVPPETRTISGTEFSIGRDQKNDWVLPDPDRFLSKRHCVLSLGASGWQIADTSTNGTYLNHDIDPIREAPRGLRDGDRILLGAYEMEVSIQAAEEPMYPPGGEAEDAHDGLHPDLHGDPDPGPIGPRATGGGATGAAAYSDDRLLGDPFPPSPHDPLGLATGHQIGLPDDYDPLAPADELRDNAPVVQDRAFLDARYTPPRTSADLLPDDWDDETPLQPAARTAPAAEPPPVVPPAPAADPLALSPEPVSHPPLAAPDWQATLPEAPPEAAPVLPDHPASAVAPAPLPELEPVVAPPPAAPPSVAPSPSTPEVSSSTAHGFQNDRATAPAPVLVQPPAQRPGRPADPAASAGGEAGFAAFLEGAGVIPAAMPGEAVSLATLRSLGGAFRAVVHGIRRIMIGRASIKGEFRIEQTMIRASGNNPLKFSADDEDALAALLNLGRRSDVSPEAAIADSLRDMRLHEIAMTTAMQEAVRDLLARLEPKRLMDQVGHHPMDSLAVWRRARGWTAFETQHKQVVEALSDDFDSVFGKAFARAYERAMAEIETAPEQALEAPRSAGRSRMRSNG
ncbi:type VI secretion system-associated FHA domain protein TagH [Lichenicola sp.]|uniref:type VI secretion system-associated FHA domain protein TagH n=1 Tax=Lichenicola sp. TaxID=2804529 RepID=UPI003B00F387